MSIPTTPGHLGVSLLSAARRANASSVSRGVRPSRPEIAMSLESAVASAATAMREGEARLVVVVVGGGEPGGDAVVGELVSAEFACGEVSVQQLQPP
ncbi:MAG: hypothetical protein ACHQC8_06305 [Solirubrobacterales bacterium]